MCEIEIFTLSSLFNSTEQREIFIPLSFNIVQLRPGFIVQGQNYEITRAE